jgi:hypothetical protein
LPGFREKKNMGSVYERDLLLPAPPDIRGWYTTPPPLPPPVPSLSSVGIMGFECPRRSRSELLSLLLLCCCGGGAAAAACVGAEEESGQRGPRGFCCGGGGLALPLPPLSFLLVA